MFAFFWGLIPAVVISLVLESALSDTASYAAQGEIAQSFFSVGLSAPFVEETVKGFFMVFLFLFFRKHIDNELDGAIYGAMVGFGFAFTEDVFYFMGTFSEGIVSGYANVFFRSFIFGSNHAFWSSIIGFAFGKALLSRKVLKGIALVTLSWFLAVFLHGLHNTCMIFAPHTYCLSFLLDVFFNFGGVILLLIVLTLVLRKESKWIEKYLKPEVLSGLISEENLAVIASAQKRSSSRLRALKKGGRKENKKLDRFFQAASELSFKRYRNDNNPSVKFEKQITDLTEKFTSLAPEVKKWLSF
ncbi:PrsW family intramembrane metalloprotease [candidate division WOR-3 bacterium]|nr:PrsW family intramembrane metalloprotease [candidate division WOR-3 bacterium]